jgi:hypothetical protein
MLKSFGTLALAVAAVVAAVSWPADAQHVAPGATYASGTGRNDLITYCLPGEAGKPTSVLVLDPLARRLVVYHINRESGEIVLKSARNITGDLGLDYWNSGSPLPQEIMKGLERTQP